MFRRFLRIFSLKVSDVALFFRKYGLGMGRGRNVTGVGNEKATRQSETGTPPGHKKKNICISCRQLDLEWLVAVLGVCREQAGIVQMPLLDLVFLL